MRDGLAAADRRRRLRDAQRQIWRIAPLVAGLSLILAALIPLAGWPRVAPVAALGLGVTALGAYAWFARRTRPVSDAAAAAIDQVAGLRGELRSAGWFAAREVRDEWADLHVERAAGRIKDANWSQLYPAVRARRAQLGTAAIAAGAILLAAVAPERVRLRASPASPNGAASEALGTEALVLTPELQEQLEALLAAAERGDSAAAAQLSNNAELRDLLNKLSGMGDPELLEALARAVAERQGARDQPASESMAALAERARQAVESGSLSPTMQDALQKLADELEIAKPELAKSQEPGDAAGPQPGDDAQANESGGQQNVSIQFARDAADGGGAMVMMSGESGEQGAGAPGAGTGGAGGQDSAASTAAIEAALKQELVEAGQDNPGGNVDTDVRRKTEHGNASVGFTRSESATFDRSRAAAPPPVPEARRTTVQTYFVRPPQ